MSSLETLQEDLKKKKYMDIAKIIVQYQKFKTKCVINKFPSGSSEATMINYFNCGINYLKTKERNKLTPTAIYDCVDELLERHVQPLTPSVEDERRQYNLTKKYTKKETILPVNNVIKEINNNVQVTANIEYGVKFQEDNKIILMKNRDYALGFVEALKYCGKSNAKVITVEIGDINS